MSPVTHTIISAGLGSIFWAWFQSWQAAVACVLSGVILDFDHLLDYFLAKGRMTWRYSELEDFSSLDTQARLYLFLHSFEAVILLWAMILLFRLNIVWVGIALGITVHMLADQLVNPLRPLAYFLLYRLKHGFKRENLFTQDYWKGIAQKHE